MKVDVYVNEKDFMRVLKSKKGEYIVCDLEMNIKYGIKVNVNVKDLYSGNKYDLQVWMNAED